MTVFLRPTNNSPTFPVEAATVFAGSSGGSTPVIDDNCPAGASRPSLVRKPGAFARYLFREQMFPTMTFRLAYDALKRWRGERADVEYVRILHLAATTMESTVDSALALLLEAGDPFDYATVKDLANPAPPGAPMLSLSGMPDLRVYDALLAGVA